MTRLFRRRDVLATAAGAVLVPVLPWRAAATPDTMQAAIKQVVGTAEIRPGRIRLQMPPLAENGNAVSVLVTVESPMTEKEHVRSIHLFAEANPLPNVINVTLGPRAGRARFETRMRLATTQRVTAIAKLSDGTCWMDTAQVVVTLAACIEDL